MTRPISVLALGLVCGLAALGASPRALPQAPAGDPQRPTFRAGVNFVRIDVFASEGGRPVTDLRAEDFAVQEDGVAQVIQTFEHVVIRGGTEPETRQDPRNTREMIQAAADARNRLFVLFLDTYHVTDPAAVHNGRMRMPGSTVAPLPAETRMGPPTNIDRALNNFLKTSIGPDDLIAAMMPGMNPADLTFIRKPESIEQYLGTTWARRFSPDNLDPVEERYFACYPPDDPQGRFTGMAVEMVARKREAETIQSLRGSPTAWHRRSRRASTRAPAASSRRAPTRARSWRRTGSSARPTASAWRISTTTPTSSASSTRPTARM